ncbi:hypothetical protein ANCCAN_07436 [Ancylostoma caninum]|uniref:Peptidase M12A domain-containing protein n=1 Tax=Ancylostoma caninum TaxID=29170 RepID=A0A368GQD5_ANCCA|nr:hypothetical protein ANCCAN_07436 [Ancylostoma caninum]
MHYKKDAFAKPGTITMETLDKRYQVEFSRLSFHQTFIRICKMYGSGLYETFRMHRDILNMLKDIIGNQEKPSKLDYKKICTKYKCDICMGEKMKY